MISQKKIGLHYDVIILRVVDGDTIIISYGYRQHHLRLYAIDAPELQQKYGPKSAQMLKDMIEDKASIEVINIDKYKRIVGLLYPYKGNPRNSYNLKMVRDGHAFWSKIYGGYEYGFQYAEQHAIDNKLGVWNELQLSSVKPWDYRKSVSKQPINQSIVCKLFKYIKKILAILSFRQIP